ncbi:MAG: transposase [Gammaproteobacteria bacterium]|nr:transposase [Gammaproteobacteria bacterium]
MARKYDHTFKLDAVKLALSSDKSQAQVARDLGISEQALYNWVSKYRSEVFAENDSLTPEQALNALRREVAQLREERDILKKAASYFTKHQS